MKKQIFLVGFFLLGFLLQAQTTLDEGFESWPPENWEFYLLGDALDGWRDDFNGNSNSGTGSAYSSISNEQSDNWMVSPAITIANANYELNFWELHTSPEFYDKTSVLISSGSGDPTNGDFVEVFESTILNTEFWEQRIIDLSTYNGQTIYVAFRHEGMFHAWNIDDVSINPVSFTDGSLTQFISPQGVSETPNISSVIIEIENRGTTVINDFSITWNVNTVAQTTYNEVGLNLQPGQLTNINIGDFNFDTPGQYDIDATLVLIDDFDNSNNQIETSYDISSFKDGGLVGITPEGLLPINGVIDVVATVTNFGENTLEEAEIFWSVSGIEQTPFVTANLNILSGETMNVTIGNFNFLDGISTISATLNALGDTNSENDTYEASAYINVFQESFEGAVFPPEGWSINFGTRDGVNFGDPIDGEFFYVSTVDDNFFGEVSDSIYSPILNIENGDTFSFYIKTSPPQPANNILVSKNPETGEVTFLQNIANSPGFNTWALREFNISAAAGQNQIGIISTSTGGPGESRFDFFTSTAELFLYDNDLKILNGDMDFIVRQNTAETFTCTIRNSGRLPVLGANYTLKLMEAPGVEVASVTGVDLASWEKTTIDIPATFTEIANKRLYFEIEYAVDEFVQNNTFREATVSVVPNTVQISAVGSSDVRNLNFPFTPNGSTNSLGEDDLSQMLFYNDEFSTPGLTYGIAYKYDNLLQADKVVNYPLQVWVAQTDLQNLDGGWLPNEELTLVFDGVVEILPGFGRDLYIPFDTPILLNGLENVVIKSHQYDPEWPPSIFRFLATNITAGPTRSISVTDVFDLDPLNPPAGFNSFASFAFTRFVIDPSVFNSNLTGFVFDAVTNDPIENATISIQGSGIETQTDVNGAYTFPELPYGTYDITASFLGFEDNTLSVTLNSPNQNQDFFLNQLEEVEVVGTVFGSNATTIPLASVTVELIQEDSILETVTTDASGDFIFPIVFGGSEYELRLSLYGYFIQSIIISPEEDDIILENIILQEELISPFDVVVDTQTQAEPTVNWKSPKFSNKVKLQRDLGVISNSYTNEPNEEVWLGNIFEIDEITTLTSVEIRTDIFENAIDFVTIDIFDIASNEVIASSEPFLIQQDSLQTINIPNIVVTTNVAAMIHWQNNAASTNSLTIDFSDPDIPNAAIIKYPAQPIELLSEFFGGGDTPNLSFLLRLNTLDDGTPTTNNETVTYNLYRGLASEFPNISNWQLLTPIPVEDLSLVDTNTDGVIEEEIYRYAVETIYTEGPSEVTFSNEIEGQLILSTNDYKLLEVIVFPNPVKGDFINIKIPYNSKIYGPIKILDVLGKLVLSSNEINSTNNYLQLNLNSLATGVYFLKMNIDNVEFYKRIIRN